MSYDATRDRVEHYFDRTATKVWERLTSDAPVSRIRETVRKGRDQMRDKLLSALPSDLNGVRVLDAGCGAGQMTQELAQRGADVVAVDISPSLVKIARDRLPEHLRSRVTFASGDMLSADHGSFDHVIAMDSLIYYTESDIRASLSRLGERTRGSIAFTVAPRTPLLMTMWYAGKAFPRSDRSPVMIPHGSARLSKTVSDIGQLNDLGRVNCGFYISQALEFRP
ncbi:magnesium protoporphyrin IX methyltransferase [Marivita geojedonensis]|uniref:Magnesium protoporphyrin IX methyltransferase n=1 Tax=Marivita geojedonensis TaxID=1123756 RepID=A0A1X4NGF7_9RHOB|nr:magnesium protoporphyrin IX methyltransferase [Marivita geojedonensis]OSQ46146.1 SAM-dependent methlyltransferase [Marivita geojedonensis]PRY74123.1 Mg-protoporphyrin IX methyltransferase [Marivita geojedonensis]